MHVSVLNKMWLAYEETRWPKALDLESTILRLEKTIAATYREFVLDGNRPEADMDQDYRQQRYQEFHIATEAVENYQSRRITLEDLIGILVQVKMQYYITIDYLPYYVVRKFNLDGMGYEDDSDEEEEETCDSKI